MRLFAQLTSTEKKAFTNTIQGAVYSLESFIDLDSYTMRMLYLHYFASTALISFLEQLRKENLLSFKEARDYLRNEGRAMYDANVMVMSKLKTGAALIDKLRGMVDYYVVVKSYRPKQQTRKCIENFAA